MQRPILLPVFSSLREKRYLEAAAKRVSRKKVKVKATMWSVNEKGDSP
jgi:hypothetical protein